MDELWVRNEEGEVLFIYKFNRLLTRKEIEVIFNNPYSLFEPYNKEPKISWEV